MEIRDIIAELDKKYPLSLQEKWDNSGLQIGDINRKLDNIIVSLDLEFETINEAIKNNCNLIINHHPLFFNELKNIDLNDPKSKKIEMIIKNDISVYAMHTNLDSAIGGVNDNLCKILGLQDTEILEVHEDSNMARFGYIEEQEAESFAKTVKEKLNTQGLILYGNPRKKVKKIAVCGGAGASFLDDAILRKCDLMITGDVKYHEAMDYTEKDIVILDPGHFASENHIIYEIKRILKTVTTVDVYTYSKEDSFRKFI